MGFGVLSPLRDPTTHWRNVMYHKNGIPSCTATKILIITGIIYFVVFWLYDIVQFGRWLTFWRNKLHSAFCLEGLGRMLLRKGDSAVWIFDAVKSPPLTQVLLLEWGVCYICTASTQVVGLQGDSVSWVLLRIFRYWWYADEILTTVRCCWRCGSSGYVMLRRIIPDDPNIPHLVSTVIFFFRVDSKAFQLRRLWGMK
jgi:hypothetical protein